MYSDEFVPNDEEAEKCLPFLRRQVYLVRPKVIVCLAATALKYIAGKDLKITTSRGIWLERKGVSIMPTFHPAALLRDPDKKREAWEDFKKIKDNIDILKCYLLFLKALFLNYPDSRITS